MIFKAKANEVLDRMEDPRETLEYSYQRQLEMLAQVKRGVSDVVASRKRLELQMSALRREQAKLEDQGRLAPDAEREAGRGEALRQKTAIDTKLWDLAAQHESLRADEEKLTAAHDRLAAKVEAFRAQKMVIQAAYTAAEAQDRADQVWSSISEEIGETGIEAIPYPRQRELLTQLLGSIKRIALSRERLDRLINSLRQQQQELQRQHSQAANAGEEDQDLELATQAAEIDNRLQDLMAQLNSLQVYEEKLSAEYEGLTAKVEALRPQNEATEANSVSSEAQKEADLVWPVVVEPEAADAAQDDPH